MPTPFVSTAAATAGNEPSDEDLKGLIEHWDRRVALRQKLQNLGQLIKHLTALFHEFEGYFECEEAALTVNCPHSSHQDMPGVGNKKQPTPMFSLEEEFADVDEVGPKLQSHDALLSAIQDNDVENMREQLQRVVDPNVAWTNASLMGKEFVSVTPLAAAVLQRNAAIVHMLVGHKASLESEYSFTAGAEQNLWTGTVVNACGPSSSLDTLKYLVQSHADVHALSSNGANLLWQAAYFGHTSILEYLIDCGIAGSPCTTPPAALTMS